MTTRLILTVKIRWDELVRLVEHTPALLDTEPTFEIRAKFAPNGFIHCSTAQDLVALLKETIKNKTKPRDIKSEGSAAK
jgi:hypothetical protein